MEKAAFQGTIGRAEGWSQSPEQTRWGPGEQGQGLGLTKQWELRGPAGAGRGRTVWLWQAPLEGMLAWTSLQCSDHTPGGNPFPELGPSNKLGNTII